MTDHDILEQCFEYREINLGSRLPREKLDAAHALVCNAMGVLGWSKDPDISDTTYTIYLRRSVAGRLTAANWSDMEVWKEQERVRSRRRAKTL